MRSFKVLFCLYVTLAMLSANIWSILSLLSNAGQYFLMMILMLGSNGLYCVNKLHETEKL